jgi:hypothetical protein
MFRATPIPVAGSGIEGPWYVACATDDIGARRSLM